MVQAHGIATPAAQQAPAKCSSAADTPAAALVCKIATRTQPRRDPRDEHPAEHRPHPRRMGRRLLLERRHRAPAGRRLPRHCTAVPVDRAADDVARLRQVLDLQDGPAIVAGHSYGGQIMTALGADAPNVAGLVYIAAFGLDQGESLGALLAQGPVTPALAHLVTDPHGFNWLSEDDFVNHFAADIDPVKTKVMYAVQQPLAASVSGDVMGV